MLELSKTQSVIVECLKDGPKTAYEIEQTIDRGKDFSPDYVKSMVFKINQKRRIIDSFNRDGQRCWRLIESAENVEYQIREELADLRHGTEEVKDMIYAYPYRATVEMSRKMVLLAVVGAVAVGVLVFALGYFVGSKDNDIQLYIDEGVMERYIAGSGTVR